MASVLKILRILNNDKQQEIAKLLGVSLTSYNNKENGKASFTLDEAKVLSDKYKVSLDKLISDTTKEEVIKLLQG